MQNDNAKSTLDSEKTKADDNPPDDEVQPKEVGGRGGLDPTRYSDWEKAGRCIDF